MVSLNICVTVNEYLLLGTTHGFASRPNMEYPEVKEGFEQAFEQTVNWFNKTIPA